MQIENTRPTGRKGDMMEKFVGYLAAVMVAMMMVACAFYFLAQALGGPIGYYYGSELLGVGVVEGDQLVQYELEDFQAKHGEVPRHEAVQVGPNWQPRRSGEEPEPYTPPAPIYMGEISAEEAESFGVYGSEPIEPPGE